jgi:uncharacterized OsmC-like protein
MKTERVTRNNRRDEVDTDAYEETLKRWVEAVEDRCPVSDNLGNSTPVRVLPKNLQV